MCLLMLDCKELTGKESAEKYEPNCKRKSKKKKRAWERMLCAKKAWVNRLTTEKSAENHSAALYRECKVTIPA